MTQNGARKLSGKLVSLTAKAWRESGFFLVLGIGYGAGLMPKHDPVDPPASSVRSEVRAFLGLLVLVTALFGVYSFAKGLAWGFDDALNLSGLSSASDKAGLMKFIFEGVAGPTGRPVSLLAFVPDYEHWPSNPMGFVYFSLVWHALNAGLIFLLIHRLIKLSDVLRLIPPLGGALLVACVWSVLAIHASSILMPVQRMTIVSAFFSLAAIVLYLFWRSRSAHESFRPWGLLLLVFASFAFVLSVYAKENGVVTISYIALIELVLLSGRPVPFSRKLWRTLAWLGLLVVPVAMLFMFWNSWLALFDDSPVYRRDFDHEERLATQAIVLWEYLKTTILPRASGMGPYHDGHPIYGWGSALPWIAATGWIALAAVSVVLARKAVFGRVMLFAVMFFLFGHQLESSVLMLELYFEHRNYLPVLGLVLLFIYAVFLLRQRLCSSIVPAVLLVTVMVFNLFSVQQIATIWGQPLAAAELWYREHPRSGRAVQMLAGEYQEHGYWDAAIRVLDDFVNNQTAGRLDIAMQATRLACYVEDEGDIGGRFQDFKEHMGQLRNAQGIAVTIASLGDTIRNGKCDGISVVDYRKFLLDLMKQEPIVNRKRVLHHVYFEAALTSQQLEQQGEYVHYMKEAYKAYPSVTVAQRIAGALFSQRELDAAISWLTESLEYLPDGFQGLMWSKSIISMRDAMEDIKRAQSQNMQAD